MSTCYTTLRRVSLHLLPGTVVDMPFLLSPFPSRVVCIFAGGLLWFYWLNHVHEIHLVVLPPVHNPLAGLQTTTERCQWLTLWLQFQLVFLEQTQKHVPLRLRQIWRQMSFRQDLSWILCWFYLAVKAAIYQLNCFVTPLLRLLTYPSLPRPAAQLLQALVLDMLYLSCSLWLIWSTSSVAKSMIYTCLVVVPQFLCSFPLAQTLLVVLMNTWPFVFLPLHSKKHASGML